MKILKLTTIVLSVFIFLSDGNVYSSSLVRWYDYNTGVKIAKRQKKPVLVDFYAEWCSWCQVMDREIFSDKRIASTINRNFICVRIRTDSDMQKIRVNNKVLNSRQYAAKVGVKGLPSILFLNEDEDALLLVPGYVQKDVFGPILKYIGNRCYENDIDVNDYVSGKVYCSGRNK